MQYRRLTKEELEPLKEEFLKYLLVANITPKRWNQMKKNEKQECEEHLDIFSDLVFEKVLEQVHFIDRILPKRVEFYHCQSNQFLMYALEAKNSQIIELEKEKINNLDLSKFHCIQGKKRMSSNRKQDIFDLLQKDNTFISDGALFKRLALLLAK